MKIYKGKILNFQGSWSSGLGMLIIKDEKNGVISIPCDNAPTVRALENAFGDVIGSDHTVKTGYKNKEIYYCYDELGLTFGGFIPVEEAEEDIIDQYESQ